MDDVVVRSVELGDVDVAARLRLRFLAEFRGVEVGYFDAAFVDATHSFLANGLADGTLRAWVLEVDGEPAGAVSEVISHLPPKPGDHRTGQAHVLNLWVDPRFRRRGLGRRLLQVVEDDARSLDLRLLVLHTTEAGRAMYAAAGFQPNELWRELDLPPG